MMERKGVVVGLQIQVPQLRAHNLTRQAKKHQMEDLFRDTASPEQGESSHPGRISSKPVPLCVCRLNRSIREKQSNVRYAQRTCGSGLEGGIMPGGKVLLMRVLNDDCSDHRVLRACSSKARQVHASDTRLRLLRRRRQKSMMTRVNSLILIIG